MTELLQNWSAFAVLIVILIAFLANKYYLRPQKLIKTYVEEMEKQGYKVYRSPFSLMGASFINELLDDLKQHKDIVHSYKHVLPAYDVAIGNIMDQIFIYFLNPKLINQINTFDKVMLLQKSSFILKTFMYLGGEGLITSDGHHWKNHRKFLGKVFNQGFIKSQVPNICHIAEKTMRQQHSKSALKMERQDSVKMNLSHVFSKITSRVVLSGFLGLDEVSALSRDSEKGESVEQVLRYLLDNLIVLATEDPLVLFGPKKMIDWGLKSSHRTYASKNKTFRDYIKRHIDQVSRKIANSSEPSESMSMIETILRENTSQTSENKYDEKQITDEIMTFALAGTDTTAAYATFIVLQTNRHPRIMHKVRQEIEQVLPPNQPVTVDKLKQLKYLDCVMKEVSRMYNPVESIMERKAPQDTLIHDIHIRRQTRVGFLTFPMFFDSEKFQQPHQFRPERWENSSSEQQQLIGLAFGGGPRACIGRYLALLESKIIVVQFLKQYKQIKQLNQRVYSLDLAYSIDKPEVLVSESNSDL